MKELIGRRIERIEVEKGRQWWMVFHTDKGPMCYHAVPDCCSETWFSDVLNVNRLLGNIVTDVTEIEMPEAASRLIERDGRGRQESDNVYGYTIRATGSFYQDCEIIFRNSSNGYYGGSVELIPEVPTIRKEYGRDDEALEWELVTKDWIAGKPEE